MFLTKEPKCLEFDAKLVVLVTEVACGLYDLGAVMPCVESRNLGYAPRLGSIRDVRREMTRVYRAAKAGAIDVQLVGRLTHVLNSLVEIDRDHMLEQRIEALEAIASDRPPARHNGHHVVGTRP